MKFAKTFVALLLLCVTVLTTSAQDKDQFTGSLLWKISGKGLTEPSYILGTHHLTEISFLDSIAGFENAMSSTQQVVGELDMSDMQSMQAKIMQASAMPEDESYADLLSPEDYVKLDKSLKVYFGGGLDKLGKIKPGMLSMMHAIMLYAKYYPSLNLQTHESIDAYLQRIAREGNKPVLGLETAEDQIEALFETEPIKKQAEGLICQLDHEEEAKELLDMLNKFYHSGNLQELYNLSFSNIDEPCSMSQEMQNAILKNRNDNWLKQLPDIMKDNKSLIVVGALHLAGEEGLLYQLSKMGYNVEAVK